MIKRTSALFFLFIFINIMSLLYIFSSSSWIRIWVGIELNLYSFVFLLILPPSQDASPQPITAALSYFIVQAVRSLIFILGIFVATQNFFTYSLWLIVLALLIKIGAAPFHFWVPWVSLNSSWPSLFWLLTFQKLPPLFLLQNFFYLIPSSSVLLNLILSASIFSALIGGLLGLFQTRLQSLLAYSSINQTAWFLLASVIASNILIFYYTLYLLILFPICLLMSYSPIKTPFFSPPISNLTLTQSTLIILIFLNLAGIPPLAIFCMKITIFFTLSTSLFILFVFFTLILGSAYSTFYYLQFILNCFSTPQHLPKLLTQPIFSPTLFISSGLSLLTPLALFYSSIACANSLIKTYNFHL